MLEDRDDRPITLADWYDVIERRKPLWMSVENVCYAILYPDVPVHEQPKFQGRGDKS